MRECLAYQRTPNSKQNLQCQACSHFCQIKPNRVGICGIRQNHQGELFLLPYGKAVAAHVDPIEKKPFYHFLPGSRAYSFGTFGCNLKCENCQNFDISQILEQKGQTEKYSRLNWGIPLSPEKIIREALAANCQSIAYTYTEPTIFLEYCLDTMELAHQAGLKNVWVSNGFMSNQTLDLIIPHLDAINIDIKSLDPKFYQRHCGAQIEPILENCQRLIKENVWLEITTLIIPELSDSPEMLSRIARFIKNKLGNTVPWHLSSFSGAISWKLSHLPPTSIKKVIAASQIGKQEGLKYIYPGNLPGSQSNNTFCPNCQATIIQRINYTINQLGEKNNCPHCEEKIPGHFR
jgi:pyruvate formate lyase activating enzyme